MFLLEPVKFCSPCLRGFLSDAVPGNVVLDVLLSKVVLDVLLSKVVLDVLLSNVGVENLGDICSTRAAACSRPAIPI